MCAIMQTSMEQEFHNFKVLKLLGGGGFGSVSLIQHPTLGEVAYKKFIVSPFDKFNHESQFENEAKIQQNLHHPNIVPLYSYQLDITICGLFLEYVKYGPVDEFVKKFEVTWELKVQIIYEIALALFYLHKQTPAIIHGDLKCQNILIGDGYHAKISDFGLAQTMKKFSNSKVQRDLSGTIEYIAPEYMTEPSKKKTEAFDVYAYGITVWEIFSGKAAYYDFCDRRLIGVSVQNGMRPCIGDIPGNIRVLSEIQELIQDCWRHNGDRPNFENVKELLSAMREEVGVEIQQAYTRLTEQEMRGSLASGTDQTATLSTSNNTVSGKKTKLTKFIRRIQPLLFSRLLEKPTTVVQPPLLEKNNINKAEDEKWEIISSTTQEFDMIGTELVAAIEIKKEKNGVAGVAWLEHKIYVVCSESERIYIFPDRKPVCDSKDHIMIKNMKRPSDMAASRISRSIFISDRYNRCLFKIQMPGRVITQRTFDDGEPRGLSVTPSDELLVVGSGSNKHFSLRKYKSSDVCLIRSIPLRAGITVESNAVESLRGTFIIAYKTEGSHYDESLISEVSVDGEQFIHTFNRLSPGGTNGSLNNWNPCHLSIDEYGNVFVADYLNGEVCLLNSRLTDHQILSNRFETSIPWSRTLCYLARKQQLLVGHTSSSGYPATVSIFSLKRYIPRETNDDEDYVLL